MRGDTDQVAEVRNRRASLFPPITLLKMARTSNTRFGRSANALDRVDLVRFGSTRDFSSWLLYAGISAWYIKTQYNGVECRKIRVFFSYCTVTQQPSKFLSLKQSITWKQAIRFFIDYGTVARLGERSKQSYTRSVTDAIY